MKVTILEGLHSRVSAIADVNDIQAKAFVLNFIDHIGFDYILEVLERVRVELDNPLPQLSVRFRNQARFVDVGSEAIPERGRLQKLFLGYSFALLHHAILCEEAASLYQSERFEQADEKISEAATFREFLLSTLIGLNTSLTVIYHALFGREFNPPELILHDGRLNAGVGSFASHSVEP